jgi:hypothetical protein
MPTATYTVNPTVPDRVPVFVVSTVEELDGQADTPWHAPSLTDLQQP